MVNPEIKQVCDSNANPVYMMKWDATNAFDEKQNFGEYN
jgi:hypothetical protein